MGLAVFFCALTLTSPIFASRTITVDDDAPADFSTIQAAIDDANDGDEVVIQPGTYAGPGNRDIDFKGKAITVRGTDPNDPNVVEATVVDCQYKGRGFNISFNRIGPQPLILGLSITGGISEHGGAISCYGASPTIANCNIFNNRAIDSMAYGGGISCRDGANPKILGCNIHSNVALGNRAWGAGVYCDSDSAPIIRDCIISSNSATGESARGGGIHSFLSNPIIANCVIMSNECHREQNGRAEGGGILCDGSATIRNCLVAKNLITGPYGYGAGIMVDRTYPGIPATILIRNCTVTDNTGPESQDPQGISADESTVVTSCIIWGNGTDYFAPGDKVSYCNIGTGWYEGGVKNINADPCFVDAPNGDYRLMAGSPCIDAGDPAYVPAVGETDIYGKSRMLGGRIDIGASEFPGEGIPFLGLSKTELSFVEEEGSGSHSQILKISNVGGGTLNWQITENSPWLTTNPASGSSNGQINDIDLIVDTTGLSKGQYSTEMRVAALSDPNNPLSISVSLRIVGPQIHISPESMSFAYDGVNLPSSQELTVTNDGGGTLNWTLASDCNWLTVEPELGSLTAHESNDVIVSVDVNGLTWGDYVCQLAVSDPNSENLSETATVSLQMHAPVITLSTEEIEQTALWGSNFPIDRSVWLSNSGRGTLSWQLQSDCSWLSITPQSGSISEEEANDIYLALDPTGLDVGTYECLLRITSDNAENTPHTLVIRLVIAPERDSPLRVPLHIPTIQGAVDIARTGDTIVLAAGTYSGPGNYDVDFKGKALTIRSTDPNDPNIVEATVIDCNEQGRGFYLNGCVGATIKGLTITNGLARNGGGVYVQDSKVSIINCDVANNATTTGVPDTDPNGGDGGGIYCHDSSLIVSDCAITNNSTGNGSYTSVQYYTDGNRGGNGGGIYCSGESSLELIGSNISSNATGAGRDVGFDGTGGAGGNGGGIYCIGPLSLRVTDCTITRNTAGRSGDAGWIASDGGSGAGIYCTNSCSVILTNVSIAENATGHGGESDGASGGGNSGAGGSGGGIYCVDSQLVIAESAFKTNSGGDGGDGIYDLVTGGPGGSGGAIYGASSVIKLSESHFSHNRAGHAGNARAHGGSGGAVCCDELTVLDLFDCEIRNNVSGNGAEGDGDASGGPGGDGGGMCAGTLSATNCTIASNLTGGGGVAGHNSSPRNGGHGGGIYCTDANLVSCSFVDNTTGNGGLGYSIWMHSGGPGGSGGALYCTNGNIVNCAFLNNLTGDGADGMGDGMGGNGGAVLADSVVVENSLLAGNKTGSSRNNSAGLGGGIYAVSATIANCTIAENALGTGGWEDWGHPRPMNTGGGLFIEQSLQIQDSIIWRNQPNQIYTYDCSNVTYSNIQDGNCVGINGNISSDPLFIEPGYWADVNDPNIVVEPNDPNAIWVMGDYHLSQIVAGQAADSPCVDAGSDTAANLGMDIYTTRTDKVPDEGIVDMGYHYIETVADLNDDGIIDAKDIAILGSQWRQTPTLPSTDIAPLGTGDGIVDIHDLAMLADWWLWPQ